MTCAIPLVELVSTCGEPDEEGGLEPKWLQAHWTRAEHVLDPTCQNQFKCQQCRNQPDAKIHKNVNSIKLSTLMPKSIQHAKQRSQDHPTCHMPTPSTKESKTTARDVDGERPEHVSRTRWRKKRKTKRMVEVLFLNQ